MYAVAYSLFGSGETQEAVKWYQSARDLGEAHGFFSLECFACLGLGTVALGQGREEEGLDLLRNAALAAPLVENEDGSSELIALSTLIPALISTGSCNVGTKALETPALDEAEPWVLRFREVAKERSRKTFTLCREEFEGFYLSARLHKVMRILVKN